MNLLKLKILFALLTLLCAALPFDFVAANAQVVPDLGGITNWTGTRELAADDIIAAFIAVNNDTPANRADTLLRLLKLGVINSREENFDAAISAFATVKRRDSGLATIAANLMGDAHLAMQDTAAAISAYSDALLSQNLPQRYRREIFAKIRPLVNGGATLPTSVAWLDEYNQWARTQRMFNAAALEAATSEHIRAGRLAEADSLLEQHLGGLGRRDACAIIDRVFSRRNLDTTALSTRFLFSLATQAHGCRNFQLSENILKAVKARRNVSSAVTPKQLLFLEAQIAYSRNQWREAIDLYTRYNTNHGPDSDAIMNIARAYRNLNNQAESRKWYDLHIRHFPSHERTQEILWLRAWNTEESRDYRAAAAAYRRVFNTRGRRVEEAHIRHALCYYRMGQYDSTITFLTEFQRKFPQSSYLWSGMFWQGKSHKAAGRIEDAHKIWTQMAKLDPTDYHSHRARQLMGISMIDGTDEKRDQNVPAWLEGINLSRRFDTQVSDAQARAWLDAASPSTRKALGAKDSLDIRRGAALLAIALPRTAEMFLGEYERNYSGNLRLQYEMATAYAIAGDYALAFRVSRRLAWRIPMERRERMPVQVLTIIYPPFYSSSIIPNGQRFNVEAHFVSAVMRQESIFDKNIVSPAGAIGLMQIMPNTGKLIASELKETFATDSLYSPELNIRFGTYYLRKRLTQFGGDKVLALCSYNAGPNNAARWRDRNRGREFDLFIEDIGFFETRGYVKKVLGNYWTYRVLANTPGYEYSLPYGQEPYPWVNDW